MICVELHTSEFRGDHTTDIVLSYALKDGETVEGLADRMLEDGDGISYSDHVVIRKTAPAKE